MCFHLCTPFVGGLCLTILWARLSKAGLLVGYFASVGAALIIRFVLEKESSLENKHIQLIGLGVALASGFLLPVLITLITTKPLSLEAALGVWNCVQEIDNPLIPWPEVFTR
ncbi:unnamed protein product [Hydatigera taeniaeformis]|uniref:Uncharacterized protein n=1 Tax=Hydatigena taeniaeformis TaxID=6205 RepID=A0A3P7G3U9_HYDTA|nr:unnamed protein product [Hydatigera taeniaeformis]